MVMFSVLVGAAVGFIVWHVWLYLKDGVGILSGCFLIPITIIMLVVLIKCTPQKEAVPTACIGLLAFIVIAGLLFWLDKMVEKEDSKKPDTK